MKVTREGWCVLIRYDDGREFYSCGSGYNVAFFQRRKGALDDIAELVEHKFNRKRMKAVRVRLTVQPIASAESGN